MTSLVECARQRRVAATGDVTNVASRKVIEAGGRVLEDQRGEKLRFWISTDG